MLGYDFKVSYRKGINNRVVDALSQQPQLEHCQYYQLSTSSVISSLLERVRQSYANDDKLQKVIQNIQQSHGLDHKYSWDGRFLLQKGKIMVGNIRHL